VAAQHRGGQIQAKPATAKPQFDPFHLGPTFRGDGCPVADSNCALTGDVRDDFGQERGGGRGESYLRAQAENVRARARGIETLLGFVRTGTDSTRKTVVDVLGGDGLVRRVAGVLGLSDIVVLTCDASPYMVREAWAAGHPALRQRADRMVARDNSVDGVLVAYGSHHIAAEDRADVDSST
jgi:hypothetical protein